MAIASVSADQNEIIGNIMHLCGMDRFDVDVTFGNGGFWKKHPEPLHKFDLDPQRPDVVRADSGSLPLSVASVSSVIFDPPFVTYVRAGRTGNGNMVMARRFGGYWKYSELEAHYRATIIEAHRVLKKKGVLVIKCQDIVHNHKLHPTHVFITQWADQMFCLKDFFVLTAKHRMPIPPAPGAAPKVQRHARIHHSYFMVMEKL